MLIIIILQITISQIRITICMFQISKVHLLKAQNHFPVNFKKVKS